MKDLIEKLKDKNYVRAFGLMTKAEQMVFEGVGEVNCLKFHGMTGVKELWLTAHHFCNTDTYAIKPDYKPEPEYVDYLIEVCDGEDGDESDLKSFLGVKHKLDSNPILPREHTYLYALSSLPNFHWFWYEPVPGTKYDFTDDGKVAGLRREGHEVYARFRS